MPTGIYSVLLIVILSFASLVSAEEMANDSLSDTDKPVGTQARVVKEAKGAEGVTGKALIKYKCYDSALTKYHEKSYTACGDGSTVMDDATGLMWARCAIGKIWNPARGTCDGNASIHNWKGSFQKVEELNKNAYLSYTDWRLPNLKEMASIVETTCKYPAINLAAFPNVDNEEVWTSTVFEQFAGRAWYIHFGLGQDYPGKKPYFKQLRPVRLGYGAASYNIKTETAASTKNACVQSNPLKFTNITDVPLSSTIRSEQVELAFSGDVDSYPISIDNGEYQLNDSGVWTMAPGTVKNGDKLSVRHLSSDKYLDDVITTVYVGASSAIFRSTTMQAEVAPYEDVMLDAEILFAYKSSELSAEAKASIDGYMDQYSDRFNQVAEIIVIGHTDGIGSQKYNQKLSEQRARSVANYIESIKDTPDSNIEAIGKGKLEPIASNDTEEGRAKNRRVVLRFVFN